MTGIGQGQLKLGTPGPAGVADGPAGTAFSKMYWASFAATAAVGDDRNGIGGQQRDLDIGERNVISVPARDPQHLAVRGATEVVGQIRIAYVPRQHHAADAQGDEGECSIAHPRLVYLVLEDLNHLLCDLPVGGLDCRPTALDVGGRPKQWAAAVAILEVLTRKIGVDDPLGLGLPERTRPAPLSPSRRCPCAQELPDGRRIELTLAAEVSIEAAMGEAGAVHDLLDGHCRIAVAIEKLPGAFEDFFACGVFVLRCIGHGLGPLRGDDHTAKR